MVRNRHVVAGGSQACVDDGGLKQRILGIPDLALIQHQERVIQRKAKPPISGRTAKDVGRQLQRSICIVTETNPQGHAPISDSVGWIG